MTTFLICLGVASFLLVLHNEIDRQVDEKINERLSDFDEDEFDDDDDIETWN